jgi:hypothetical protein
MHEGAINDEKNLFATGRNWTRTMRSLAINISGCPASYLHLLGCLDHVCYVGWNGMIIFINWKDTEENDRVYWQPKGTRLPSEQMSARTLPIYPRIRFHV